MRRSLAQSHGAWPRDQIASHRYVAKRRYYGALGEHITTFGAGLRRNDLTCSARVAVMLPDGPELAVSIVAVACHAAAVPLNPRLTETELDDLFAMLRIDAVVVSDRIDRPVREIATRHGARLLEVRYGKFGAVEIADSRMSPSPCWSATRPRQVESCSRTPRRSFCELRPPRADRSWCR